MSVGIVTGSPGVQIEKPAQGPQTAKPSNNVPKVDNDGDSDNGTGADDRAKAAIADSATSADPLRGKSFNIKA